MGITKIQSRYVRPLLLASGGLHTAVPKDVSTLSIDATATIYAAVANVCGYGNRPEAIASNVKQLAVQEVEDTPGVSALDMRVIEETVFLVQLYLSTYPTSSFVHIAFDGRIPSAKLKQQRTRRWVSAKFREKVDKEDPQAVLRSIFDTTKITPGTRFLEVLDAEFMKRFPNRTVIESQATIIYSSYRDIGEGEHKLIELLRSDLVPSNGSHVLISADSDMIVLASTLEIDNLYVYRDNLETWVSIDRLRYALRTLYGIGARLDAVLILQVLGNDFVPPQPSFLPGPDGQVMPPSTDKEGRVSSLFEIYRDLGASVVSIVDGKVVIDWQSYRIVMKALAEDEYKRLSSVALYANKEDARWTDAIFTKGRDAGHYDDFRAAWYGVALADVPVEERPEEIKKMVGEYLRAFAWTCVYYLEGRADSDFVYSYSYAPLLSDIVSFDWSGGYEEEMSVSREEYLIHIPSLPDQLLSVLPNPDPDSVYGIIHDFDRENFPLSENIEVDTLGLDLNEEDAEVIAVNGLTPMNNSTIVELTSLEYLQQSVGDDDQGEAIYSLFVSENKKSTFVERPALVMEKRAPLRQEATARPRPEARRTPRTDVPSRQVGSESSEVEKRAPIATAKKAPVKVAPTPKVPPKAPVKAAVKVPPKAPAKMPTK